ncbi:MAG TPA: cobalamin-dependent protein, partial [bacterium]|nr:cobalamin-dependent protein [bacterium]
MNILLISPPVFDFYSTPHRMEPLGLLYIKKTLVDHGYSVEIYDATASGKVKAQKIPKELEYLNRFYEEDSSPFSLHSGYKRFGDSFNKIIKFINDGDFDIIGISSLFSAYHPDVEELVKEIKNNVLIPIVIGGTAVTAQKEILFENSLADFMVAGCGTESMPLFADFISGKLEIEKVPGLIYRKNGKIFSNEPSNEPAWSGSIIPVRENLRIFRKKKIAKTVFSSGCMNRCSFCSIHRDNKFALRDITHIRNEFEYLKNIGTEIIDIEDDDIFSDPQFTKEVLKLLEEFHKYGIQFTAMNGLTAKNILPIADELYEAGFMKLDLSLVTSSEKAITGMKRPHDIEVI